MTNYITKTIAGKFDQNNLPVSDRGTTMYQNTSLSGSWGQGGESYVAIAGLTEAEANLIGFKTFILKLSFHDNVLAAAWVAKEFHENREYYLSKMKNFSTGTFCDLFNIVIPTFDFEPLTNDRTENAKIKLTKSTKSKPQPTYNDLTKTAEPLAKEHIKIIGQMVTKKYGSQQKFVSVFGTEQIVSEMSKLTVSEYVARYGLASNQ